MKKDEKLLKAFFAFAKTLAKSAESFEDFYLGMHNSIKYAHFGMTTDEFKRTISVFGKNLK